LVADRGAVKLLDEVLEAHGGLDRWRAAERITARVRSGGLLLRTRVPGNRFADYRLSVEVHEPRAALEPFPRDGLRGVLEQGTPRIEDTAGALIESRPDPGPEFSGLSGLRRNLRWDALDATYFAGYAMWNYLTTPLLLTRDEVTVREGEPWTEGGETWQRLEAEFGGGLDTHSPRQTFYFDAQRRLRRHDYVARVVGSWAHAAHYCDDHAQAGGLVFPTRRRVRPVGLRNRALPGPTLVSLDLSEIHVEPHPPADQDG
jgi:hypothetical protein